MNFARTSLCIALTFATTTALSQPAPGDSLSLRDAVELVLTRNPAIEENARGIDAAEARVVQSRAGLLPSVDVEATYTFLAPVSELALGGIDFKVFPSNNYDGHVGVRQLLFDFQKTGAGVDLSSSRAVMARDALEMLKRNFSFSTAETFYTILFLHRSIDVQDEQIQTLNEHLLTTRRRIESGTATKLDALTTQVRVASAQTQRINLESMLHRQEIALRRLASLPPGTPIILRGEFLSSGVSLNQDSLQTAALAHRIESAMARDGTETARLQTRTARLNDMPSLNAIVAYGVKNGYIPNLDAWRGNVVAGVEFKLPLFDGNRTGGMEEEADANLRAAESRKRDVDLTIQADVQQAISDVRASLEKLRISEIDVEQAALALETARLRYEAGTVANLDLLDAESARAEAKRTNLEALYEYVISTFRLRRAVGNPVLE